MPSNALVLATITAGKHLKVRLTDEGREEIADAAINGETAPSFEELMEYETCNGLDWIRPEWIGALTDAPIITDGIHVWWYQEYAVLNPVQVMEHDGFVTLTYAGELSQFNVTDEGAEYLGLTREFPATWDDDVVLDETDQD